MPVALITAVDGVCHPTLAALIISRQCRRNSYPHRGRLRNRARTVGNGLSDRGRAGLVAATGGDSAGVSQTDAGRPWAAAAAALLVIHGVVAGMRRESQLRLWDVRYIHVLVEGGWSGGWNDGRRSGGMSPLIG